MSFGRLRSARFLAFSTSLRIVLTPIVVGLVLLDGTDPKTAADVAAALCRYAEEGGRHVGGGLRIGAVEQHEAYDDGGEDDPERGAEGEEARRPEPPKAHPRDVH